MTPSLVSTIAGTIASLIFVISTIPSLTRVYRTRNGDSYSLASLWMATIGNTLPWVYVLSLPPGPLYALHTWNTLSAALLLVWCVRYRRL